jgi:predicted sulfurtransferase
MGVPSIKKSDNSFKVMQVTHRKEIVKINITTNEINRKYKGLILHHDN